MGVASIRCVRPILIELVPTLGLFVERVGQTVERGHELVFDRHARRDVHGRGKRVVGRLAHVDVIVGMHRAGLALATHRLAGKLRWRGWR